MNKQDLKEIKKVVEEAVEPYFTAIKSDFNRIDDRFEGIDKRFDKIDERFDKMDKRMDYFEMKLDSLDRRVIAIEDMLTEQGKILRRHEQELVMIRKELGEIKRNQKSEHMRVADLEKRVARLETKIVV